jgi:hypothetical protein
MVQAISSSSSNAGAQTPTPSTTNADRGGSSSGAADRGSSALASQSTPADRMRSPSTPIEALRKEPTGAQTLAQQSTPIDAYRPKPAGQDDGGGPNAVAAGVAGAGGREQAVQKQMSRAYEAGRTAPQSAFDGTIQRSVSTKYESTALDATKANAPNRYKSSTERVIYTSPDTKSALAEAAAYNKSGHPLADRSLVEMNYKATPGADGRGGVADLEAGLKSQGMSRESLTSPKGGDAPSLKYQITGEHPYTLGQQANKGALDAGASGVKAPSAVTGHQINILPANTQASQITPLSVTRYDAAGNPSSAPASGIQPMVANDLPVKAGALNKPAGLTEGPGVANEGSNRDAAKTLSQVAERTANGQGKTAIADYANNASEGRPRAGSGRYGAAGGVVTSLGSDVVSAVRDGKVDVAGSAMRAGEAGVLGYGAARATDALANRGMGMMKGGAVVTAAVESVRSGYSNYQAYQNGQISGSRAVANTAVDTGVAVGAGLAGMKAGAVVGTMIGGPAGTVVGAAVGFAAGTAVYLGTTWLANQSGAVQAAKDGLTSVIDGAGGALKSMGSGIADGASKLMGIFG